MLPLGNITDKEQLKRMFSVFTFTLSSALLLRQFAVQNTYAISKKEKKWRSWLRTKMAPEWLTGLLNSLFLKSAQQCRVTLRKLKEQEVSEVKKAGTGAGNRRTLGKGLKAAVNGTGLWPFPLDPLASCCFTTSLWNSCPTAGRHAMVHGYR